MSCVTDTILNLSPILVFVVVGLLVFAEDALFVGFVLPGETAAVLGGVVASQGRISVVAMCAVVVLAAIAGDSVGYEVGRKLGPRLLQLKVLDKRRAKLDQAQDFLRRRGGSAVFLGRFIAFFRAVMPALAGTARMRYPVFLAFNALGGLVWGIGFVLLGYLAGASYKTVEKTVGRDLAIGIAALVVIGLVVWRVRAHRRDARTE
ncbi:DedA family protein [Calidifontibacter sp. DB0510]|uniref:DedA family protein n=1 Tax=Metallococcus carri TaxID=1656884 RepID=A0A967B3A5_9MICO|nr:DedA family protein [Metallococcus carri]NHN57189.1 DedA family protein [Metallococcus carri]NOP38008.1 DedA family protein [Calidifontibacter sp. DB2511S]